MSKSIIIIGAGIAGLSAGCYGQMNGYQTTILEQHNLPGGLCTSWKRKGYTFDGCIHWLCGSGPGVNFYRIWEELGAIQGRKVVDYEVFVQVEGEKGKVFKLYTNPDRLEEHMKTLSPADAPVIEEMIGAIRRCQKMSIPVEKPQEWMNIIDKMKLGFKMFPLIGVFRKYGNVPLKEFAKRFQDPFLREVLTSIFDMPDFPLIAMFMTLSMMANRGAGYPIGGSLEFARAIEKRYLDLGGEIHYQSPVAKILVEQDRAVGVRLADGREFRADQVISAADGHATIFEMLGGAYISDELKKWYDEMPIFPSMVQVSLGVNRDLSSEPHSVSFIPGKKLTVSGVDYSRVGFKQYCFDPTMAPQGKSVIQMLFGSDMEYWQDMNRTDERYQAEKQRIAEQAVTALEERYPGIRDQIEVIDVATPLTFVRYAGNWRGSIEGWMITTRSFFKMSIKPTLPGLENFHMIGQWVKPGGGLPPAAQSGRDVIYSICQKDKKRFMAARP